MAEKKNDSGFTVTDRRLFTSEGDLRSDVAEEVETPKAAAAQPKEAPAAPKAATVPGDGQAPLDREMPPPPTAAEQEAKAAAYKQSARDLDKEVEWSGDAGK